MGVRLLPPRLYRSELANRESLRDTLLELELDTADGRRDGNTDGGKKGEVVTWMLEKECSCHVNYKTERTHRGLFQTLLSGSHCMYLCECV